MNASLKFKTVTFIVLSLSILLSLSVFMITAYQDTRSIVSKQVDVYISSLASRYEKDLSVYLDLVEENFLTIRSNESLVSSFHGGDKAHFLSALSAWEEDYERTRYDFLAVSFPASDKCFFFAGYFTNLRNVDCTSLFQSSGGLDNYGWKIIEIDGQKLGVFSTPLNVHGSGKIIGQLIGGIKLSDNTYLLNRIIDTKDNIHSIDILHQQQSLSSLRFPVKTAPAPRFVAPYQNPPTYTQGNTVFGKELVLRIESADTSITRLRMELFDIYIYGGLVAIVMVFIISLALSRSLDSQLQSLMSFVRRAHLNRHTFWKQTHITEFNDIGHQIINIVRNLQEQEALLRRNNEDKRRILHHLIQTEEKERLRLSNDLHDDIGQLLAALKANVYFIREEHTEINFKSRALNTTLDIVNLMYDAIYNRIGMLRSSEEMQHFGLAGSLPMIAIIPQLENLDYAVEINIDQHQPLRKETMVNLYRIAQEGLTNVLKYASGTWVLLQLTDETDGVRLRIQDDGVGFTKGSSPSKGGGGFGLISIRERVEHIGGEITISANQGVCIDIFVPAESAYLQEGESNELLEYPASKRTLPDS